MARRRGYGGNDIAADLVHVAEALVRSNVCLDVSPIHSAAQQCKQSARGRNGAWQYTLSRLAFDVESPSDLAPSDVIDLKVLLSVDAKGKENIADASDPFEILNLDLVLEGRRETGTTVLVSWHFDRHIIDRTATPAYQGGSEVHPLYHVQYGGRNMKKRLKDLGETFLLGAPRLLCPPMETVLAIDFVLGNFCPSAWDRAHGDGSFRNRVANAYERFWKPFFNDIASIWNSPASNRTHVSFYHCPNLHFFGRES